MKFILGYIDTDTELVQFTDKQIVDNVEEWCEVEADTLDEAKDKYEEAFANWQKANGLYMGDK